MKLPFKTQEKFGIAIALSLFIGFVYSVTREVRTLPSPREMKTVSEHVDSLQVRISKNRKFLEFSHLESVSKCTPTLRGNMCFETSEYVPIKFGNQFANQAQVSLSANLWCGKRGLTLVEDHKEWIPQIEALGVATNVSGYSRKEGDAESVYLTFTTGTPHAAVPRITVPTDCKVAESLEVVGTAMETRETTK